MDRARFQDWVSSIDELTAARCPGGKSRGLRRSLQVLRPNFRRPHRHGAVRAASQGAVAVFRRGARHSRESVTRSAGERVRRAVHIQTATSRHSRTKGFLRRFRGIATKCLDSYPRWFHLVVLGRHPSPRACLAAASARTCLRFAN